MKSLTAVASTALQLVYVLTLLGFIVSMIRVFEVESLYASGDPKTMAGSISSAFVGLLIGAIAGLFGVFLAWLVLRDKKERPAWFLPVSTFFAWTWLVFVPIGTAVGVLMLRWRRSGGNVGTTVQA